MGANDLSIGSPESSSRLASTAAPSRPVNHVPFCRWIPYGIESTSRIRNADHKYDLAGDLASVVEPLTNQEGNKA